MSLRIEDPYINENISEQDIDNFLSIYLLMLVMFPDEFTNN